MPQADTSTQPVTGPDGKLYQFPKGTTKDQAVAYFKSKGIGVAAFPAPPPVNTSVRPRTFRDDLREAVAAGKETLPAAGAIAGVALAPETAGVSGLLIPPAAAALGGATGEAARQGVSAVGGFPDRPKSWGEVLKGLLTSGLAQAGLEMGGRAGEKAIGMLAGGPSRVVTRPEDAAVKAASEKYGLGLSPAEIEKRGLREVVQSSAEGSILGRATMQGAKERTVAAAEKAVNDSLMALSQPTSALATGQGVQKALTDARSIFSDVGKGYATQLDQDARGVLVNISSLKQEALSISGKLQRTSSVFPRTGGPSAVEKKLLDDLVNAPDYIPFRDAATLRTRWMSIAPQSTEMMPTQGPALARHFVGRITEEAEKAAGNLQGDAAVNSWKALRAYWKDGAQIFDRGLVQKLVETDPSMVVRNVKSPEDVMAVKKALLGYGVTLGRTPAEKQSSQTAWDAFRQRYVREVMLGTEHTTDIGFDPLRKLAQTIHDTPPEVLKELFSDARGRETYTTLKEIGAAIERVNKMPGAPQISLWRVLRFSGLEEADWVAAKLLTHPRAARRLLYAIRQVPRSLAAAASAAQQAQDEGESQ